MVLTVICQNICFGKSAFREVESVTAKSSCLVWEWKIIGAKMMTDPMRIRGKGMGKVMGMGIRASWVTTVNTRSWCVTGETGPGNKTPSHVEEAA